MTSTDQYRTKAIEFSARALTENDPKGRDAWNELAAVYLRLAEQADRNSAMIVCPKRQHVGPSGKPRNRPP